MYADMGNRELANGERHQPRGSDRPLPTNCAQLSTWPPFVGAARAGGCPLFKQLATDAHPHPDAVAWQQSEIAL